MTRTRVVVAPDKFRGSLSAVEAAEAIGVGVVRAVPDADVVLLPVADGGEGTVDVAVAAGYSRHTVVVEGPTGEPVRASFAVRGQEAVIELAEASGLRLLPDDEPAPLTASTYGTGQLVLAALDAGARHLVLGVGGSASTDGGAGMAQALGARFLDADGRELARGGAALTRLDSVQVQGMEARLAQTTVVLAGDVDNPLLGPDGAAAVFGPQKGASALDVVVLEKALTRYAEVVQSRVADRPGAGAAGGAGAGAMAFLGARFEAGIDVILEAVGFAQAVRGADLVITGEGSMDAQSLAGKAPVGVARAARAAGVDVVALVGRLQVGAQELAEVGIGAAHSLLDVEPDPSVAMADAALLLAGLAERAALDMQSFAYDDTRDSRRTERTHAMTTIEHPNAEPHQHTHGPGCGHESVIHADHVDYLHDGHVHREHPSPEGTHYDECSVCQCANCSDSCATCSCTDCTCTTCNHATCECANCSDTCANCTCAECTCATCTHAA